MYILDTNVISELRAGKPRQSQSVREWASRQPANQLYLSAITVLELQIGVMRVERKDAQQGKVLRNWLDTLLASFAGQLLPFNDITALHCAPMHVPDKRSDRDAMIAATAKEHGYAIVTRNTADFEGTGVPIVNPWNMLPEG